MRIGVECTNQEELSAVSKYFGRYGDRYDFRGKPTFTVVYNENNRFLGNARTSFYDEEELIPNSEYKLDKRVSFQKWKQLTNQSNKVQSMKYSIQVNNQDEVNLVYKTNLKQTRAFSTYPVVVTSGGLYSTQPDTYESEGFPKQYGPLLTFEQFTQMHDIDYKPSKTLKLTNDYSAVVDYKAKVVRVGCQTIPFVKVEELAKLIKE